MVGSQQEVQQPLRKSSSVSSRTITSSTTTHAPVVKATTLPILFVISAHEEWDIHQMDVAITTYLNSDLPEGEIIYKEMPQVIHLELSVIST